VENGEMLYLYYTVCVLTKVKWFLGHAGIQKNNMNINKRVYMHNLNNDYKSKDREQYIVYIARRQLMYFFFVCLFFFQVFNLHKLSKKYTAACICAIINAKEKNLLDVRFKNCTIIL
jgi:hypothetical protein